MRLKRYAAVCGSILASGHLLSFAIGFACAAGLAFGTTLAIGTVGFSTPAVVGLLFAAALGLDGGLRFTIGAAARQRTIHQVAFVAWLMLASALADGSLSLIGSSGLALSFGGAVASGFIVGLVTIALPLFLSVGSVFQARFSTSSVCGCSLGFVACPLLVSLAGSALLLAACGVAVVALLAAVCWLRVGKDPDLQAAASSMPANKQPTSSLFRYSALFACGIALAVVARVMNQTVLASAPILFTTLGLTLVAVRTGMASLPESNWYGRLWNRLSHPPVLIAAAIGSLVISIVCFPVLVRLQLWLTATVQYPALVWILRAVVVAVLLAPLAMLVGACGERLSSNKRLHLPTLTVVAGICVGFAAHSFWLTAQVALGVGGLLALLFVIAVRLFDGRWLASRHETRFAAASVACLLVVAVVSGNRFEPEYASRLLFSSGVFQQYFAGVDTADLLALDESRLLETEESSAGVTSRWRYAGSRVQIRRNGLPTSVVSVDTSICPQPAGATLPVVLPLLLHQSPDDVLLLGDVGPVAKATALMFPLQSITAVDQGIRTDDSLRSAFSLPDEDDRFSQASADPAIAVAGIDRTFDVVLSHPPQAALLEAAPYYTSEFYGRVTQLVGPQGLFCQTFSQIDFGADPLRRVLKSLRAHFEHVSAVQLTAGEILFVGKNGEPIIGEHVVKRASFAHVRRILDDLGWDWSRVLGLASLDSEAVDAMLATSETNNTVANAAFAWGLPVEMMRWADKRTEIRVQIAGYQRRILDQLPEHDLRDEAARRLLETGQESEVLFGFPDEPWMYRKTLRTRLEQNPRPPVEVVVANDVKRRAHKVDQLRIEYFRTLANAIQTGEDAALRRLQQFVSPAEPLVSYFATHELARIYAQREHCEGEELKYRLRSTYFAPGVTRSVREVVAAIELLANHPELVADAASRWDQMNSLLQVLTARWSARRHIPPASSRVALNDIEKSLLAIDQALTAMSDWQTEARIDVALCSNRERFLRSRLERPLRRYRDELMPHHYKADSELMVDEDDDQVIDQFRTLGN